MNDHDVLDVHLNATKEEILRQFKKKAIAFHPDKNGNENDFIRLCEAKDRLLAKADNLSFLERSDPMSRRFESENDDEVGLRHLHQQEEDGKIVNYLYEFLKDNTVRVIKT